MPTQMNKLNFEGQNIYAGFDVHLKSWKVTILSEEMMLKTFTMPPKPEVLSDYLLKSYPGASYYSAYEAGFSGLWAHYQLCELGINNIVVNPADVPGTQKDKLQKEDKRDSRKIAYALRNGNLTPIYTPSESTLNDRSLVRSRKTLVNDMIRFKNRIKAMLNFYGISMPEEFANSRTHWNRRFMLWLESIHMKEPSGEMALKHQINEALYMKELLKSILLDIKHLSETDKYREKVKLLRSIPGIALLTAITLLTEIEDINRFPNSERFASFIGLIPMTKSSGEKQKVGELTFRAHDFLRSIIIESSWVGVHRDPALLMAYQKLIKRMEPNNAIIRIAKKLSNRIYTVLKYNKTYEFGKTDNL